MLGVVLRNKELLRLDFGIFALHAMLIANFLSFRGLLHLEHSMLMSHRQWMVYLPVMLASVAGDGAGPSSVAEKYRRDESGALRSSVAALAVSQINALLSPIRTLT